MTDLRELLGDRYTTTIQAAVLADNPAAITAVDRLTRVLTAILPDLLAQAWDEGYRLDWTGGVRHIRVD